METQTVETKIVCPRCSGTGELKSCAHVKGGVCFNCWGCGSDLVGEIKAAEKALASLRRQWVRARHEACPQDLAALVVRGKKAASSVTLLVKERETLAARFKS